MGKSHSELSQQTIPARTRRSGESKKFQSLQGALKITTKSLPFFCLSCISFVVLFATNTASAQQQLTEAEFQARMQREREAQLNLVQGTAGANLNRNLDGSPGGSSGGAATRLPASTGSGSPAKNIAVESAKTNESIGAAAFGETNALSFPMTPDQLRDATRSLESTREASRPAINSIPETSSQDLDMRPGSAPPILRVAALHGSVVNFLDSLGNPWPVKAITNFNSRDFEIAVPFPGASTLTISNLGFFGTGNVAVFLEGLDMPVTVGIYGGQKVTDYRKDFRILKRKPGAVEPTPTRGLSAAQFDPRLNRLVDGVPPENGVRLKSSSPFIEAYQLDDKLVLRTQLTLLSAFDTKIPAADGTTVYSMAMTPAITVSESGRPKIVTIDY